MKKTISMNQAGVLVLFTIFIKKMLLLPSLMYEDLKADAIFAVILLFALEFVCLPIFFKLKRKFPDKKFFEILKEHLSTFVAKLIYIIIMVFVLFKVLLTFSIVYVYFKQQIYQGEFVWIALVACVAVVSHAVIVGLRPMIRTMEALVSVVLFGFIFCLVISIFTPISTPTFFESSALSIFSSIYKYSFVFGDFIALFLLIDRVDYKRKEEKKVYFYAILGAVLILILFILFYSKYQVTAFMHNNALADLLVFSVQFNAVGRLDIISMLTIMTTTLFQIEILAYLFCDCFVNIFPLLSKKYAVAVFDILFLLLYYVFIGKYERMVYYTTSWLPVIGVIVGYVLPIILLIISLIKRRKNERSD